MKDAGAAFVFAVFAGQISAFEYTNQAGDFEVCCISPDGIWDGSSETCGDPIASKIRVSKGNNPNNQFKCEKHSLEQAFKNIMEAKAKAKAAASGPKAAAKKYLELRSNGSPESKETREEAVETGVKQVECEVLTEQLKKVDINQEDKKPNNAKLLKDLKTIKNNYGEIYREMVRPSDGFFAYNWCDFRKNFNFAEDNNDYIMRNGDTNVIAEIKREDWAAYDSEVFTGKVLTYRAKELAEAYEKDPKFKFPSQIIPLNGQQLAGIPSDHLPVFLTLKTRSEYDDLPEVVKIGTFNILSHTKSSMSAASFPGFPEAAWKTHNGFSSLTKDKKENPLLDRTAKNGWLVKQLDDLKEFYDFIVLQEVDLPMYNALRAGLTSEDFGFDMLQQCEQGGVLKTPLRSPLTQGWVVGKAKDMGKDIPFVVWKKTVFKTVTCAKVGMKSSIGFCQLRFIKKTGTMNILAMHGDGGSGFSTEEAQHVQKELKGQHVHAVIGDLNLGTLEEVKKSMEQLSATLKVPVSQQDESSVFRWIHPLRKTIQNQQNTKSYQSQCTGGNSVLKCPVKGQEEKNKMSYKEKGDGSGSVENSGLEPKESEKFFELCMSVNVAAENEKQKKVVDPALNKQLKVYQEEFEKAKTAAREECSEKVEKIEDVIHVKGQIKAYQESIGELTKCSEKKKKNNQARSDRLKHVAKSFPKKMLKFVKKLVKPISSS